MLDPNWFFSTLAQSTAALIGMLGGMLIIRLMDYKTSDQLVGSKERLDSILGGWRHNILATNLNATQREPSKLSDKAKKILQEIYQLAEREEPYLSLKRYKRLCNELLQQVPLLQQDTPHAEENVDHARQAIESMCKYLFSDKDQIIALWEKHNRRLYPMSLYVMFAVLVVLGGIGVIVPLTFLTGFHHGLFLLFIVGYVLLFLCVAWLFVDLIRVNRIRPARDVNYLPHKSGAGGIMFTVH